MPRYKLTYFNVWGIAEPIRFIFKYAGIPFEDVRIKDKDVEWPKVKSQTPYGQVPVLEIDGEPYAQTIPICHYLAKQVNLIGKTDLDALKIDGIAQAAFEFRKQLSPYFFEEDPTKKQQIKDNLMGNIIPYYMTKFENLASNNGGYLHGHQLSYADLYFTAILDAFNNAAEFDVTKDYPHLKELNGKVRSLPSISAWLQERPKSDF